MKTYILSLYIITLLSINVQAFQSGTYICKGLFDKVTFILKDNGKAKSTYGIFSYRKGQQGYWYNDDDAAIVIREGDIIEKIYDTYRFNTPYNLLNNSLCKKIK